MSYLKFYFFFCFLFIYSNCLALYHNLYYPTPSTFPFSYILQKNKIPIESLSISIRKLENSQMNYYNFNENILRNPASTMKLVTSFLALSLLGENYKWKTEFFTDSIFKQTLEGNIIVKSQADPKLVPETLLPLLENWKQKGIENLNVNFIFDNNILSNNPDSSSSEEDKDKVYSVNPQANNFAFNTISLSFKNNTISNSYPIYNFSLISNLKLQNIPCQVGKEWAKDISHKWITADNKKYFLELNGKYSSECNDKILNIVSNIPNNEFFVYSLLGLWQSIGGKILINPKISQIDDINNYTNLKLRPIGEVNSYPLKDLLKDVNKFSNNLMARLIFLRLGIIEQNFSLNAKISTKIANKYLSNYGLSNIVFENGSGLSNSERITTNQLVNILGLMYKEKNFPEFLATLPIVGVDGTMKNRLKDIAGKAYIKTGTLKNVKSIAGYIQDKNGGYIAISAIINHENILGASEVLDEIIRYTFNNSGIDSK